MRIASIKPRKRITIEDFDSHANYIIKELEFGNTTMVLGRRSRYVKDSLNLY